MKKKLFSIVIVAAVAAATGWNYNQSSNEITLSDVALSNVEALANGESSGDFTSSTDCEAVWENVNCKRGKIIHTYARPI